MRIERRQAKLGVPHEQPQPQPKIQEKTLKDFLAAPKETDKHQLKVCMYAYNKNELKSISELIRNQLEISAATN